MIKTCKTANLSADIVELGLGMISFFY